MVRGEGVAEGDDLVVAAGADEARAFGHRAQPRVRGGGGSGRWVRRGGAGGRRGGDGQRGEQQRQGQGREGGGSGGSGHGVGLRFQGLPSCRAHAFQIGRAHV